MAKKKRNAAAPAAARNGADSEKDASEPDGIDGKKPAEKPKSVLRGGLDFVLMIAGAVLAAFVIKAYAFDVYLIPSGSMETALHGRPDGGDRIFCSKLNFRFRQPKRWEVAVFEFPYETARRADPRNVGEQYKGQNFVKRVVGLPGESLVIAKGDIWARQDGDRGGYQRLVKPDTVQRGMWLRVYEQDFKDISLPELERFWRIVGGDARLRRGGPLVLAAVSGESVRMDYRAMVPAGAERDQMTELPGIPDRYTLEQPVQFKCAAPAEDGERCGHVFVKTIRTHNIEARCPRCGSLEDETSAIFYHRRSGLTTNGRYAVNPQFAPQGEDVSPRQAEYHIVPDLRVRAELVLEKEETSVSLALREDGRAAQAVIWGNGQVEIQVNGQTSAPERRALSGVRPGRPHKVEFYIVEGTARLYVDGSAEPVLESLVWEDRRPAPQSLVRSSGVSMVVGGGEVRISSITIDRDIFYYSGWEQERGERFAQMNVRGEVFIDESCFFPMGDHCPSSFDARSWGPVPLSLLRGPALLIWWPPERIGLIPSP